MNAELQKFENIECEWPVFLCYFLLDALFNEDDEAANHFWNQLQKVCTNRSLKHKVFNDFWE